MGREFSIAVLAHCIQDSAYRSPLESFETLQVKMSQLVLF